MEKKIINRGAANRLYGSLVSAAKDAITAWSFITSTHAIPNNWDWYLQHGSNATDMEKWYADRLHQLMQEAGISDFTEEGRLQIEGTRREFYIHFTKVNDTLKGVRHALNNPIYKWAVKKGELTFSDKSLRDYADDSFTFEIDEEAAKVYFSMLTEIKEAQRRALVFEQLHGLPTISDTKASVIYYPYEFAGMMGRRFNLATLMGEQLTEEGFEEVFATLFSKK